jgi:hypothetical protein
MKLVTILTRISFTGEVEQIHVKGGKDHPTYQTSNHMDPVPNQSSIDLHEYDEKQCVAGMQEYLIPEDNQSFFEG